MCSLWSLLKSQISLYTCSEYFFKEQIWLLSPPPCILTAWQCNHGPGQHFMGASLITTSTAWPLWGATLHLSLRIRLTVPSHHHPSFLSKQSPNLHPPMLTCTESPIMPCRSKGHAWPVMVDWASDITALFGDHSKACPSPCQSFLTAKRLTVSYVEFRLVATILHLTLATDILLLDSIHLNSLVLTDRCYQFDWFLLEIWREFTRTKIQWVMETAWGNVWRKKKINYSLETCTLLCCGVLPLERKWRSKLGRQGALSGDWLTITP